nr:MAG TPA: hypothetical protein [Inoviridae sp.]
MASVFVIVFYICFLTKCKKSDSLIYYRLFISILLFRIYTNY